MATTEWIETTSDAASVTKAAVAGSSHYITGIHASIVLDSGSSDAVEAAYVQIKDGTTVIFNSVLNSVTDDKGDAYYSTPAALSLTMNFTHPIKITSGKLCSCTVTGISGALSSYVQEKINLMGYTEVDAEIPADESVTKGEDKTVVHVNPGSSDGAWWRS